jgi:hypothetical protein
MKFDERNQIFFLNPPFFISMATAAKFVLPNPIFWAYLVPLDVDFFKMAAIAMEMAKMLKL